MVFHPIHSNEQPPTDSIWVAADERTSEAERRNHAVRGGDRLQSGDATAHHQRFGGANRTGRGGHMGMALGNMDAPCTTAWYPCSASWLEFTSIPWALVSRRGITSSESKVMVFVQQS